MAFRRSVVVVGVGAVLLLGAASACSSTGDDGDSVTPTTSVVEVTSRPDSPAESPTPTSAAAVTVPSRPGPEPVLSVQTPPGSASGFVGARADAVVTDCAGGNGRWGAAGSVTNPTDRVASYRIYVAFLDEAGATAGLVEVGVPRVQPGKTATWNGWISLDAVGLRCLLRVERTVVDGT